MLDILVTEDKEKELKMTVDAINTIAQKIGFIPRIDTADNVKDGIRLAVSKPYDLMLVDYDYSSSKTDPRGKGSRIIKEVRKTNPNQAIYLFSGEGDMKLAIKLLKLRMKYLWNVQFIKKIWFERKPRRYLPRKQPKDVHTYENLERVLHKHYFIKAGAVASNYGELTQLAV